MTGKGEPKPFIGQGTAAAVEVAGGVSAVSIKVQAQQPSVQGSVSVVRAAGIRNLIVPPWIDLAHSLRLALGQRFCNEVAKPMLADAQHDYLEAERLDSRILESKAPALIRMQTILAQSR